MQITKHQVTGRSTGKRYKPLRESDHEKNGFNALVEEMFERDITFYQSGTTDGEMTTSQLKTRTVDEAQTTNKIFSSSIIEHTIVSILNLMFRFNMKR